MVPLKPDSLEVECDPYDIAGTCGVPAGNNIYYECCEDYYQLSACCDRERTAISVWIIEILSNGKFWLNIVPFILVISCILFVCYYYMDRPRYANNMEDEFKHFEVRNESCAMIPTEDQDDQEPVDINNIVPEFVIEEK